MQSIQINTAPLIRNFATQIDNGRIQVTTKLGTQTLVRAAFARATFPSDVDLQTAFLADLVSRASPGATALLKDIAEQCIADQCAAVRQLISDDSGTRLNS
jgi:hypothetical protein